METLMKICHVLECDIGDIVEIIDDSSSNDEKASRTET
jgi:DNA-binding Xre family transcriptional regulator